eukprot:gene3535-13602_t
MGRRKQKSSDASDPSSSAPVTESWSQKDERVKVTEGHGLDLSLSARIDGDKDLIFDILTEPDPSHAFRALKKVLYHHVLEDDGKGCKKVAICHRACAKFLFFSMTFDTHLHVVQDAQAGKVQFQLAGKGNCLPTGSRQGDLFGRVRFQAVGKENKSMKMYDGGWEIQPFSDKAMDSARHGRLNPSLAAVSSSTWMRNTSNIFNHFNKNMAMDSARHGRLNPSLAAVSSSTWKRDTFNI